MGHTQHPAQYLLDRRGRSGIAKGKQHISIGAVPALAQLIDRNDELRVIGRIQALAAQLIQRTRGNGDALRCNIEIVDQSLLHPLRRKSLLLARFALGLYQHHHGFNQLARLLVLQLRCLLQLA